MRLSSAFASANEWYPSFGLGTDDHEPTAFRRADEQQHALLQGLGVQGLAEIVHRFDRLTVGLGNHHSAGQAGQVSRAAGTHVRDDYAMFGLDSQCSATGGVRSATWIPNFSK